MIKKRVILYNLLNGIYCDIVFSQETHKYSTLVNIYGPNTEENQAGFFLKSFKMYFKVFFE